MGLFSKVKKAVKKTAKATVKVTSPIAKAAKVAAPVIKKVAKSAKKNVSVKNITKAANKVTRITYPLANKISSVAAKAGLPEVRTVLNLKKAITNPAAYASAVQATVTKGAALYSKVTSGAIVGDLADIAKKKGQEALDDAAKKLANAGKIVGMALDPPKKVEPESQVNSYSQATGEDLEPFAPVSPRAKAPVQQNVVAETQPEPALSPMLLVAGGAVLLVLVLVVMRK